MGAFTEPGIAFRARAGRFILFVSAAVAMALCIAAFVGMLGTHNIGAEILGAAVAGLGAGAGIASLALLMSPMRHRYVSLAVVVVWAIVAFGGIAGALAHSSGVEPAHGVVEPRPRPVAAPLIFTICGVLGGSAVFLGQRQKPDA